MTADELAGLRPGDRVYRVVFGLTDTTEPSLWSGEFQDIIGAAFTYHDTGSRVARYGLPTDWHPSPAAAYAAAVAESAARHARLCDEARRHGVEIPEVG